ncbi:UNVERIFIED_CONTAM: hypothetical protein Slati_0215500 [Sesamum latifolium]|uniref:Aminotransferase-like plant mobile domain-containing protein n=1 Tax=Sesamum latifolium TaxID=2727402 RepID=A0AAW2YC12_9LAMI
MEDIKGGVSNWGVAVLAYLYRDLCTASQRRKVNIGGAMQLLKIWAWSRIITIAPIPSTINTELRPTIIDEENILPHPPYAARWSYHISQTHAAHNAVRIIRNTFDRMKQNEFIWTPYGGEGPDVQSLPWPEVENGRDTVPDNMNWYHQITRIQISHEIDSANTPGYRPAERVGQMIIDYNNAPPDYPSI